VDEAFAELVGTERGLLAELDNGQIAELADALRSLLHAASGQR
jgi:hypothetical protein